MNKHLIVIQCRFGSSRLPGKALYPFHGSSVLGFLLKRLKRGLSHKKYLCVLATTVKKEDDIVAHWGKKLGVEVVRGSENDVLNRFVKCINKYSPLSVTRVTADNPFTAPELIIDNLKNLYKNNLDYSITANAPIGAGVDSFKCETLIMLNNKNLKPNEREHINKYILDNPNQFRMRINEVPLKMRAPELSLTIDSYEEWKNLSSLNLSMHKPWKLNLEKLIAKLVS